MNCGHLTYGTCSKCTPIQPTIAPTPEPQVQWIIGTGAVLDVHQGCRALLDAAGLDIVKHREKAVSAEHDLGLMSHYVGQLETERDAYRQQATAFAEALVMLGRSDLVDAAIAAAGERAK